MLILLSFGWWIDCLVGGWTNPFEKYARQNGNLLQVGVKIKTFLKPPPSCGCSWWFFLTNVLLETRWWICFGELWVQNSVFFVGFNIDSQILPRWNRRFFKFQSIIKPEVLGKQQKMTPTVCEDSPLVIFYDCSLTVTIFFSQTSKPQADISFKGELPRQFLFQANHGVTGTHRLFLYVLLRQLSGPVLKHGLYLDVPGS